jgi:hypothetical protein
MLDRPAKGTRTARSTTLPARSLLYRRIRGSSGGLTTRREIVAPLDAGGMGVAINFRNPDGFCKIVALLGAGGMVSYS